LDDIDLRLYVELCLELFDAPPNTAARRIGEYFSAKNAPRNGWVERDVRFPESVGAHTAGAIWLCNLIPEEDAARLDVERVRAMLIVHDIAEGVTGDIVATQRKDLDAETERRLIRKLSWLGAYVNPRRNLYPMYEAFKEFKERHTEEAKLAREIDSADIVVQGEAILRTGASCKRESIKRLIEDASNKVQSACGKAVLSLGREMNVISASSFKHTPDVEIKRYFGFDHTSLAEDHDDELSMRALRKFG